MTRLQPREFQIVRLYAMGQSDKSIAAELCLSRQSVTWYFKNLIRKLQFESRGQLVAVLVADGTIPRADILVAAVATQSKHACDGEECKEIGVSSDVLLAN